MDKSVKHLQRRLAKYPPKAAGAFSRLATPGQRRAYWAKVSSGESSHREGIGYVRSGNLSRRWTTEISPNGRTGTVGNNAGYAEYVQGERQQPFHEASNFPTVDEVAKKEAAAIVGYFENEYKRQLAK
jgi:hypothetical protein